MRSVVLLVPGHLETPTGGYIYDSRVAAGLRDLGWSVMVQELDETFPDPTPAALERAAYVLEAIPNEAVVLVDGLAFGAMPLEVEREAGRLRLVALVHHLLAAETGVDRRVAARLEASEKRALASARAVVVTSRATASALATYDVSGDRIAVVEPGTDRAPLARGSHGTVPELLCVAALIPRKGHETLIRALASVADRNWHLTCVGSLDRHPQTVERLGAELRANGLAGQVSLTGEAGAAALADYYDHADLFVLPTEHEGYGMAVAEALARGLPVISTATGAIADLVAGDAGLLVRPGDTEALAAALSKVLSDAGVRERFAEGARRVRDRLPRWEDAVKKMAEVLERVGNELQR